MEKLHKNGFPAGRTICGRSHYNCNITKEWQAVNCRKCLQKRRGPYKKTRPTKDANKKVYIKCAKCGFNSENLKASYCTMCGHNREESGRCLTCGGRQYAKNPMGDLCFWCGKNTVY